TYGWNSNAGSAYDFGQNTTPIMAIWDGGGIDTLDASLFSTNQIINLQPGGFSSIGFLTQNIPLPQGLVIENAEGGGGNDIIYGNDANNSLFGGAGNDTLFGYGGDDYLHGGDGYIDGGAGSDTAAFAGYASSYQLTILSGTSVMLTNVT